MSEKKLHLELNSYKPLREIVFEVIRESILNGRFAPGERLMETQLAEELGVSRTPVREAIRKLELEGLVVMVPRRGAYVASMSVRDISETFEIRAALEGLAAKLAVEKITTDELEAMELTVLRMSKCIDSGDLTELIDIDEEFHDILVRASRNERLTQMISLLREQIKRFRRASLSTLGRQSLILGEHRQILEAIAERDDNRSQRLVEEHIANAEDSLLNVVRNNQGKK
ncbi:GntR family transcriptional regulator [Clostridium sp. 'deep sea']|uniref:GntR family transcriptional regulator n=1 Tax=Clostridium sp. 'deep sea' TaxID=2779445 RepID=UPI0018966C42|nr:GntR family transcriptional regulator [Clostridium sp. 'deep sea']QOR34507.1 GntR family transcriptional regulator [Clostridium sp. 'deep sea']